MKAAGASQDEMSFMENGTCAECLFIFADAAASSAAFLIGFYL